MADISTEARRRAAARGQALPDKESGGRFPIRNREDLSNAIRAVGRVRPNTEQARAKVRRFIIRRARELGLTSMIPDTWNTDGTLKS